MSWGALAWAAKRKVDRAADKLILLALAERHNEEADVAYPSVAWLCEFSSLDRKTVIASLSRLEASGLISDSGERFGKTNQVKAYRLHIETVPKPEQSQKRNSSGFSSKESQKRDTEPSREPKRIEAIASTSRPWALPIGVSLQVWQDFLTNRKRKRLPNTETAWKSFQDDLARVGAETGIPPPKLIERCTAKGWGGIYDPRENRDGQQRTNTVGRNQPSDGLSSTARAGLRVFGTGERPGVSQ